MKKLTITKRFDFAYAHRLPDYQGMCKRMHGHNALLEVEVGVFLSPAIPSPPPEDYVKPNVLRKEGDHQNGMVMDFARLKDIVKERIVERLDHTDLADSLPEAYHPPTAENMLLFIWNSLYSDIPQLTRLRIYETPDSYAELSDMERMETHEY